MVTKTKNEMHDLVFDVIESEYFLENTYIVGSKSSKEAVIIDPGGKFEDILNMVHRSQLKPLAIMCTHGHVDHIITSKKLKDELKLKIYLHKKDEIIFRNADKMAKMFGVVKVNVPIIDGFFMEDQDISFGSLKFYVIYTPGHTPGGVCYKINDYLFSGDTLFKQSIGRTDFWGGDYELILKSIKEKIFTLPKKTVILPGHGPKTTVGSEIQKNPYLS